MSSLICARCGNAVRRSEATPTLITGMFRHREGCPGRLAQARSAVEKILDDFEELPLSKKKSNQGKITAFSERLEKMLNDLLNHIEALETRS